jgi:hypothetical protein
MLRNRFLEAATTKYLILTVTLILLITVGAFALILSLRLSTLENLAKFVDAVFKAMAILLGMVWTLNRYYVGRTDTIRVRVDPDIKVVRYPEDGSDSSNRALLIFRLDTVNIGSVLIPAFQQSVEIESVMPTSVGTRYDPLYRWPINGKHPGAPIEPGAWEAVNDAISIPGSVRAVRIYIEAEISPGDGWTWHKTFDVSQAETGGDHRSQNVPGLFY